MLMKYFSIYLGKVTKKAICSSISMIFEHIIENEILNNISLQKNLGTFFEK